MKRNGHKISEYVRGWFYSPIRTVVFFVSILAGAALAGHFLPQVKLYDSYIGFVISLITFVTYFVYLTPKSKIELDKKNPPFLNQLRLIIFVALFIATVTSIPSVTYQFYRSQGKENAQLRSLSTVSSNIAKYSQVVAFVLIFNYKKPNEP